MVHLSIIDPKEQTRHHSMMKNSDWVITVMIAQNRDNFQFIYWLFAERAF